MKTIQINQKNGVDTAVRSNENELRLKKLAIAMLNTFLKTNSSGEILKQNDYSDVDLVDLSFTFSDLSYLCKEIAQLLKDAGFENREGLHDFQQLLLNVELREE